MDTDESFIAAVKKSFGPGILNEEGIIDRDKLGAVIFSDPEKR